MNYKQFAGLVEENRANGRPKVIIPLSRRCSADLLTPVSAFLTLRESGQCNFLLESVEGGEKLARYSFSGSNPFLIVNYTNQQISYDVRTETLPFSLPADETQNIYDVLEHIMSSYKEVKLHDMPRLTCGAVGYFGYDTIGLIENLPPPPSDDLNLPDAAWCFYDTLVAFDHVKHQLVLMASIFVNESTDLERAYAEAQQRLSALEIKLRAANFKAPAPVKLQDPALKSNTLRPDFEAAIEKAKHYIHEGDIFQVVLSQRFSGPLEGDHFNLYRALRQVNPSPYLFYIDYGDFALVGSSPEVLVRVEDGQAEVLPIAGTRKRGATTEEDLALEKELLADPKERAEHLMLVDLGRNDLGKVCEYSSIKVDRYAFVERYSHVMHIVSSVIGKMRKSLSPLDVLKACFPAGTVSGAPKVRAMEIISELEPSKRGIYAGAVGYLDYSGNIDTCIAIRTMVIRDGTVYIQAGAGIVADSEPHLEFKETENKARALKQALHVAATDLL
ncbi:MAG: anthranilate synthase component I [Rhodothermales bacterium]